MQYIHQLVDCWRNNCTKATYPDASIISQPMNSDTLFTQKQKWTDTGRCNIYCLAIKQPFYRQRFPLLKNNHVYKKLLPALHTTSVYVPAPAIDRVTLAGNNSSAVGRRIWASPQAEIKLQMYLPFLGKTSRTAHACQNNSKESYAYQLSTEQANSRIYFLLTGKGSTHNPTTK